MVWALLLSVVLRSQWETLLFNLHLPTWIFSYVIVLKCSLSNTSPVLSGYQAWYSKKQGPSSASNAAQQKIKESQLVSGQKITTLRTDTKIIVEYIGLLSPKEMFPLSATQMNLILQALFVLRSPSKDPEDLYGTDVGDKSFEGAHPYRTLEWQAYVIGESRPMVCIGKSAIALMTDATQLLELCKTLRTLR